MQGEIKFRGKRIDDGEWIYGYLCEDANGYLCIQNVIRKIDYVFPVSTMSYPVCHETVGQFTGLKDKNGKDIYEGDIVLQQQYGGGKGKMIVRFEKGAFIVGYHSGSSTRKTPMLLNDICEVIGNIHDNPELL